MGIQLTASINISELSSVPMCTYRLAMRLGNHSLKLQHSCSLFGPAIWPTQQIIDRRLDVRAAVSMILSATNFDWAYPIGWEFAQLERIFSGTTSSRILRLPRTVLSVETNNKWALHADFTHKSSRQRTPEMYGVIKALNGWLKLTSMR